MRLPVAIRSIRSPHQSDKSWRLGACIRRRDGKAGVQGSRAAVPEYDG